MAAANACVVEFAGGPLDGHEQLVDLSPQELDDVILLPVGKILALLHKNRTYHAITSLALYELARAKAPRPSYQYLGPVNRD